jgi:hypothetical protein
MGLVYDRGLKGTLAAIKYTFIPCTRPISPILEADKV